MTIGGGYDKLPAMHLNRPAKNLEELAITLREEPLSATDERYVDLSEARGDTTRRRLTRRLRSNSSDNFLHMAIASHRGSGKTTEIKRLMQDIQGSYYCLYLEANVEANARQLDLEDLLLILTRKIFEMTTGIGCTLDSSLLEKIENWFGVITRTTSVSEAFKLEIEATVKNLTPIKRIGEFLSRCTALIKFESEHREELKTVLRQYGGSLLELVNQLLDAAREQTEKDQRKLLIIIDNLDRYDPEQMDRLLIRQGDTLTKLRCNLLVTPPIALVYRPKNGQIADYYVSEIMHSVRLREKTSPYTSVEEPARRLLIEALSKRMELEKLIPDRTAHDRLLMASGGAMRELLSLILNASLDAPDQIIRKEDVEKAVLRERARMRDTMNTQGWAKALARIGTNKQVFDGQTCMDILYHRFAFHYNGEGWYDVHPLISETDEFKQEKAAYEKEKQSVTT